MLGEKIRSGVKRFFGLCCYYSIGEPSVTVRVSVVESVVFRPGGNFRDDASSQPFTGHDLGPVGAAVVRVRRLFAVQATMGIFSGNREKRYEILVRSVGAFSTRRESNYDVGGAGDANRREL